MPNNILITPGSASIQFSGSATNTIRLQVEPSGAISFYGNSGSLFGITDVLSGSLMSVNDISGLPILEVFSDDRVVMGSFNRNTLVVTGSRVAIDKTNPQADLDISGSVFITGSLEVTNLLTTRNVVENIIITGSGPTSALTLDLSSGSLQYRSGSTTAHWTTNFRWNATTTLNSILNSGQSMTVTLIVNNGATPYSASTHQVDGRTFTPRWQGRTLPSASGNSTDMYTYTIIKLASASYDIFASQTAFG